MQEESSVLLDNVIEAYYGFINQINDSQELKNQLSRLLVNSKEMQKQVNLIQSLIHKTELLALNKNLSLNGGTKYLNVS